MFFKNKSKFFYKFKRKKKRPIKFPNIPNRGIFRYFGFLKQFKDGMVLLRNPRKVGFVLERAFKPVIFKKSLISKRVLLHFNYKKMSKMQYEEIPFSLRKTKNKFVFFGEFLRHHLYGWKDADFIAKELKQLKNKFFFNKKIISNKKKLIFISLLGLRYKTNLKRFEKQIRILLFLSTFKKYLKKKSRLVLKYTLFLLKFGKKYPFFFFIQSLFCFVLNTKKFRFKFFRFLYLYFRKFILKLDIYKKLKNKYIIKNDFNSKYNIFPIKNMFNLKFLNKYNYLLGFNFSHFGIKSGLFHKSFISYLNNLKNFSSFYLNKKKSEVFLIYMFTKYFINWIFFKKVVKKKFAFILKYVLDKVRHLSSSYNFFLKNLKINQSMSVFLRKLVLESYKISKNKSNLIKPYLKELIDIRKVNEETKRLALFGIVSSRKKRRSPIKW